MKKLLTLSALLLIFVLITLFATNNILFENSTAEKGIISKGIKEVKTEITFLNGILKISADNLDKLYSGEYEYKKEEWKPEISYTETDETGYLKIISSDETVYKKPDCADFNRWDIRLNKNVQSDLFIKMGAGEGTFKLADSRLNRFDFQMVAGEIYIDLRNTSVRDLSVKAIAGKVTIDLTGKWTNDLHARITGGAGELVLIIPESTGTELEITGILANIFAPAFSKTGHSYTNAAFGKTKETLHIDIFGGVGDIEIRLGR